MIEKTWDGSADTRQDNAWRAPLAMQCLPPLVCLSSMMWLPESPRYLIQTGRHEEARTVLNRLHEREEAKVEFAQIEAQIAMDNALPHTWGSLLTKKSYRKRAILALGLAVGIQFTGVLVINSTPNARPFPFHWLTASDYGSIIYGGLGYDGDTQLLYNAIFNTVAFGCGIIAMFIIDFFPRNRLVAGSTCLVTATLVAEAALVANYPVGPGQNDSALKAAVAMTFLYIVSISLKG